MIGKDFKEAKSLVATIRGVAEIAVLDCSKQQEFDELAESALLPTFPGAVLAIPRANQPTIYYGICSDPSDWRRLRPLLVAFAGPTITRFTGWPEPLVDSVAVEDYLLKHGFHVAVRLVPGATPFLSQMARRSLQRMVQLVSQAPVTTNTVPRSTSQLLSLFFDALNGNDRITASEVIEICRSELRLDALNLTFMKVQLLAHFEAWRSICELSNFQSVCHTRKPPAVAMALLEALYQTHLGTVETDKEEDIWKKDVRYKARPLLRVPISAAVGPGGFRLYAFEALHAEPRRLDLEKAVLSRRDAVEDLVTRLEKAGRTGFPSPDGPELPDLDAVTKVRRAVVSAEASGDLSEIRRAQDLLDQLAESERQELLRSESFRKSFQALQAEVGALAVPRNLQEWFAMLPDPAFTSAFAILERAVSDWPVTDLQDPADIRSMTDAMNAVPDESPAMDRLADALPVLVAWAIKDPAFPRPSMSPLYEVLLYHLVISTRRSRSTYDSAGLLIRALLSVGLSTSQYNSLLDDCLDLVGSGIGVRDVYWLLDVVEETVLNPAPDPQRRQVFWNEVSARLLPLHAHLTPGQRTSIARLASALGWDEGSVEKLANVVDEPPEVKTLRTALAGKTVSIYSLTESALRQAQESLAEIAPEARICLSHDKVGSPTLKSYAQNSDIFIIATASAKHAATGFIQQHRLKEGITLFAAGRGCSSILRVLEESIL